MRRKTALLRSAAVESLTLAIELFNRPVAIARDHGVIILAAHGFEMLLKAVIFQARGKLRDPGEQENYALGRCINVCESNLGVLDADAAAFLRVLKQDRDAAMHDVVSMSEDLLWLHIRSAVTVFDKLLQAAFQEKLQTLLPSRVLPVSASPPTDLGLVVDREIEQVRKMVSGGRRQAAEAEAVMRPLLALDGAATGREDPPTDAEVKKGISKLRSGDDWRKVLPGIATLEVGAADDNVTEVALRLSRDPAGLPMRVAGPDEEGEALAYREVSPFDRFPIRVNEFGPKLGMNAYGGQAIIYALGLRARSDCFYEKRAPRKKYVIYMGLSPKALEIARAALKSGEITEEGARELYTARNSTVQAKGRQARQRRPSKMET